MPEATIQQYNIFDLGFNKYLIKGSSALESTIERIIDDLPLPSILGSGFYEIPPSQIGSGELAQNINIVRGYLQSSNFVSGVTGWRIDADGNIDANSGTFRGDIIGAIITGGTFRTSASGERIELKDNLLSAYDDSENLVFRLSPLGSEASLTTLNYYDATGGLGTLYATRTGASSGDTQRLAFQTTATTSALLARLSVESGKSGGDLPAIDVKGHLITDGWVMNAASTQWDVSNPTGTTFRYTYDGTGTDPNVDNSVLVGDVVVISGFASANNGTFTITAVSTDYFEITNASGSAENNITSATIRVIYDIGNSTFKFNDLYLAGSVACVGLDVGSQKITNVATPTVATDAATKSFVEGLIETWVIASDVLQDSDDTGGTVQYNDYTEVAELEVNVQGTIRVKFELASSQSGISVYGKVYINDAEVGTEQSTTSIYPNYVTFTEDFDVNLGDLIQLRIKSTVNCAWKNFRLYWDSSSAKLYIDARQMVALEATVALFQANAATGTCTEPNKINDNNIGTFAGFDAINEYAEINFGKVVSIRRFRHYGDVNSNQDGSYKIQYYDLVAHAWVDWKTEIPTRLASWSTPEMVSSQFTDKVKIIAITIDTGVEPNTNKSWEFEIYY